MSQADPDDATQTDPSSASDPERHRFHRKEFDESRYDESSPNYDPPGPDWLYRWRMRAIGDSRVKQIAWRTFITVIGAVVTLAGVAMLALPGPGWAAIFLGLAILASEYLWARRLLRYSKDRAQGAASAVLAKENRGITLGITVVFVLLFAAVVSWYAYRYGWTLDGVKGWFGIG